MGTLATIAAAVHAELDAGATRYSVGAEHIDTRDAAPPYVVWVHQTVGHEPGNLHVGPQEHLTGQLGKPFLTRRLVVDVHVWAATSDAAETLVEGLLAAAYLTCCGSVAFGGERWPKQVSHEHVMRGEPVILRLTFDHPVIGSSMPTVTITNPTITISDYVDNL